MGALGKRHTKRNTKHYDVRLEKDEQFLNKAREYASQGMTNDTIAKLLGISYTTLFEWKKKYPEFAEALEEGFDLAIDKIEGSLYKQAQGFFQEETTEVNGKTYTVNKYYKPNVAATLFYLKNRRPNKWRDAPSENQDTIDKLKELLDKIEDDL